MRYWSRRWQRTLIKCRFSEVSLGCPLPLSLSLFFSLLPAAALSWAWAARTLNCDPIANYEHARHTRGERKGAAARGVLKGGRECVHMARTHGTVTRPGRSICCSIYCIHCMARTVVVVVAASACCSNILFWSFAICVELAARHGALRCPKRTVGVLSDQKKGSWEREGGEGEANSDDRLRPVGRLAWPGPHLPLTLLFGWGEACVSYSSSGRWRRRHSSTKREK